MAQTTDELLNQLLSSDSIEQFLEMNGEKQLSFTLSEYLQTLLEEKHMKKADVIRNSHFDITYAYQLFDGKKSNPTRDKLIQLAFGFGLDLNATQKLLHVAKAGVLYVKNRRDSIIIFALENRLSLIEANALLDKEKEKPLEL